MAQIAVNGKKISAPFFSLAELKNARGKNCDITVYNGYPVRPAELRKIALKSGDSVCFIKRGRKIKGKALKCLMSARNTPGTSGKFAKAAVGIAGAGGLGSNAAVALARAGIGKLVIVDLDIVEPSNLNRQAYEVSQIGVPKVLALKNNIMKINPFVEVEAREMKITPRRMDVFAGVDILIEAFDSASEKTMLAENFLSKFPEKFLIMASGLAGAGASNLIKTRKISPNFYVVGDMTRAAGFNSGLMAPRVMIAAAHQANLALKLILNGGRYLI